MNTNTAAKITDSKGLNNLKLPVKDLNIHEDNAEIPITETFTKSEKPRSIGKKIMLGLLGAATITGVVTTLPNVETAEARHRSCGGWGPGWGGDDLFWGPGRGGGDLFWGTFAGSALGNLIGNALTPRPTYYQEPQRVYQDQYYQPQVQVVERVVEKPVYIYPETQPQHQLPQQNPQPVVFAWSTKTGGRYMDAAGYLHQKHVDKAGNAHDSVMGYLDANGDVHQRMLDQNGNVTDTVIGSIYRNDW